MYPTILPILEIRSGCSALYCLSISVPLSLSLTNTLPKWMLQGRVMLSKFVKDDVMSSTHTLSFFGEQQQHHSEYCSSSFPSLNQYPIWFARRVRRKELSFLWEKLEISSGSNEIIGPLNPRIEWNVSFQDTLFDPFSVFLFQNIRVFSWTISTHCFLLIDIALVSSFFPSVLREQEEIQIQLS